MLACDELLFFNHSRKLKVYIFIYTLMYLLYTLIYLYTPYIFINLNILLILFIMKHGNVYDMSVQFINS